ncbi:MAG: hypothetical protein QMD04_04010 [Anaerolineales bacterium]|nr:hypothetical protein [Anaerolineales bacterium]
MLAWISLDLITASVSFIFTLMVLSYLVGDNPLFRLAIHIFIGVSAGYAAAVAWHQVLSPKLIQPLLFGGLQERILAIVPLLLGALLLMKLSPRTARLGNPAMAFMVGAGAAVAVGGAVLGTLFPQILASINLFDLKTGGSITERLFEGSIILIGTLTTLAYFHFGAKATPSGPQSGRLVETLGRIGQVFIAITFGVLFAAAYAAAMTALIERLNFLWTFIASFL